VARWVLDANVAVKWSAPEELWQNAALFRQEDHDLVAPDLLIWEVTNSLLVKVRKREISPAVALAAVPVLYEQFEFYPADLLLDQAIAVALELNVTLFDAVYLLIALREGCPLVTADTRLFNATRRRYADTVVALASIEQI
jgi:predicted nucleic acid-binding protein